MRPSCHSPAIANRSRLQKSWRKIDKLVDPINQINVVSTDVFDTILLRTSRSERSRIMLGERQFSKLLASLGRKIDADSLVEARLCAQRLAFRALARRGAPGEVRLHDIIERQISIMGLPLTLVPERVKIEVEVEKRSLFANNALGEVLRQSRRAGRRVIAVSDTTLAAPQLRQLIQHFHGTDLVDHVHSSADHGLTKRDGALFDAVARAENTSLNQMLHIGDDPLADVRIPLTKGMHAQHLPRGAYHGWLRSISGGLTEAGRLLRQGGRVAMASHSRHDNPESFGRHVFGPIATQFCLMIWLYAKEAEAAPGAVLLFCARGGVGIRETFERTLQKLHLPLRLRRENFMISRLIAARAALLARSPSAVEELDREFRGDTMADVAKALGGRNYNLDANWHVPFHAGRFVEQLFDTAGSEVLGDIQKQNELFSRHLRQLMGDDCRIILCDTGLYGSTQRLLAEGFPDVQIETIQFARSNYKGHDEEHFPRVTGLMVEQDFYSILNVRSCVLRYWHIIESLFEPAVPSVKLFHENERGEVIANCGDIQFGVINPSVNNGLLAGALIYIDHLPDNGGYAVMRDANVAWHRLRDAITRPTIADLQCLEVSGRSVDFGRADVRQIISDTQDAPLTQRLKSIKTQLWREGAITRQFPVLKYAFLPLLGIALSLRGVLGRRS